MIMDIISNLFLSKVTVLTIDALAIYLAILVYRDSPKKEVNFLYLIVTFLMLIWVNSAYIPRLISQENLALGYAFLKMAWFATPLFFVGLYFLVIYSINKVEKYKVLNFIILALGVILALVTGFSNHIVKGISYLGEIMVIIYGSWMLPFLFGVSIIMAATLFPIFKEGVLKEKRIQHFLAGILIFYIANIIFNITFPIFFGFARFYFFGDYSTIILLFFIAYGVIKYQMFNIKVIATELLAFAIWLVLAMDIFTAARWPDKAFKIAVLTLFSVLSYLLIRSVQNEIKQRQELEDLTQQLKVANKHLKELDKAKTEFISVASHQLRTPLSGIKGYLSMLLDGDFGKTTAKQKKIITDIFNNTERLIRLVNIFLNVSRIESGRLHITKKQFDFIELIDEAVGQLMTEIKMKRLRLDFIKPKRKIKVIADRDKLMDVLINLIDNAVKYTPQGKITIRTEIIDNNVRLSVKDTGVGIDPEEAKRLFAKFTRGKKISQVNTTGAGLGLFIAKKIVELHKGKIWVKSEGEGKGSEFVFEIPIK